jgi:two-component system LytT family sensor kinase
MISYIRKISRLDGRNLRLVLHLLFWLFMHQFYIYIKMPLLELSYRETALVAIKDVVVISAIFYFLLYYVVPRLLIRKKIILLLLSLGLIYYFYALANYLEFLTLPAMIDIPGRGYNAYAERILSSGFLGVLKLENAVEVLMDMSYLLSPVLIVKLFIALYNMSTRALKLERDNLNLELAFLKAQINPHFLFNTLNNVYSLALHNSNRTADVVLKLSDLMRYTLYDSNTSHVSLDKETQFCKNYIELERIRHSSRVTITTEFPANHDGLYIAPLIIFPFIENAFKYGINASVGHSWVNVKMTVQDTVLTLALNNSRFPVKQQKQVGGIGISNTKKRLNLLYQNKYTLDIKEEDASFSVILSLRLE